MRNQLKLKKWGWRTFPLVLLLQWVTVSAIAQVQISGRVTDKEGKGIQAISVQVRGTSFGTTTDANGGYTINAGLKAGTYMIDFSGVGFKSVTQNLTVGSGTSYTSNAQLTDDVLSMDEVVVTGNPLGTTRKQLGSYISTVKGDQLNKGAS